MRRVLILFFLLLFFGLEGFCQLKLAPIYNTGKISSVQNNENARTMESDTIDLPFWDDFSTYTGMPAQGLWLDGSGVYVNRTLALNPPTLGVATFDGATSTGGIYSTNQLLHGIADTLVSKPINLGNLNSTEINSVYLSFFWQFFGISEIPDPEDSLRLLFKNQQNVWEVIDVFDRNRVVANDTFLQVIYKLEPRFLHGSFQMKFEGYARLSGPFDAWHIDYVFLDKNRIITDKTYFDRAISTIPDYIFEGYSAMPINQFFANPEKYTKSSYIDIFNLDALLQPIEYSAIITNPFDSSIIEVLNFNTEVNPILQGRERRRLFANELDYSNLDDQQDSIYMKLNFFISSGDTIQENGINYKVNDTVDVNFTLHNYYATDDGTAEFGLGLEQYGGKLAYMFVLEEQDVLNAVEIHFPNILRNQEGTPFNLFVWKRLSDSGLDVLYERENQTIEAQSYFNSFQRIKLPDLFVADTFYIGYEQLTSEFMSVGYDKLHDFGNRIFYNSDNNWVPNDEFHGSLMIRPYFGNTDPTTGIEEVYNKKITYQLFPNPTSGVLSIQGDFDHFIIYDLTGNEVYHKSEYFLEQYDIGFLKEGIYIIKLINKANVSSMKLVIRK